MQENQFQVDKLGKILTKALLSGVLAAILNVIYLLFYEKLVGSEGRELVNFLSVSLLSIIPSVFVGLLYFSLRRVFEWNKAYKVFTFILIVGLLVSFIWPMQNSTPNGVESYSNLLWLTVPMHIIALVTYFFMITKSVPKSKA